MMRFLVICAAGIVLALTGCAPSLSPLYRDYDVGRIEPSTLENRVTAALSDAGWDTVATQIPNAIVTEERVLSNWGLYKVTASIEVTPLGRDHVRVFVHPYRKYIIGGKGKIPFLTRRIRMKFMPALNDAFESEGLMVVGTPFDRDNTRMR